MDKLDISLMYVTDDRILDNERFFEVLNAALAGGATIIQLREKSIDTKSFIERALHAKEICENYNVPLIINDRLDVALAVKADGLHVGQKDIPIKIARKFLGKDKIIGISVSNLKELKVANNTDADYIGLSPIFSTPTKSEDLASPLGIEGLKKFKAISKKPIVCIGGVNKTNLEIIFSNGADGAAVVSAISSSKNPMNVTQSLKKIISYTKSYTVNS